MTGFGGLSLADENGSYDDPRQWAGVSKILGPRWAHLPAITAGFLGVQIFWSVEMSYASPYLLSLGLKKSSMAMVFLAGPLSGLIVQPLIGVLADNCTSRWGRRRPYMIGGTVLCMLAMLLLGFTRPIASIFTGIGNSANDVLTIWLAVLSIYCIDFAINAVQAVDRALLVDTLPSSEQANGNAWGARMLAIGSVVGFYVGNIKLPSLFPFLGSTQLEVLSVIGSILLLGTHALTASSVKERRLLEKPSSGPRSSGSSKFVQELKDIFTNMLTLPPVIRQICMVQFCAWIAWFPIMFYTTMYVGDIHKRNMASSLPPSSAPNYQQAMDDLDAEATRLGTRALFYSSLLSLLSNFVLPFFVSEASPGVRGTSAPNGLSLSGRKGRAAIQRCLMGLFFKITSFKIHLATLWALSHLIFALCMAGTFFAHDVASASFLITITGFPWAITQWAPFSLLAEAILTEPTSSGEDGASIRLADTRTRRMSGNSVQFFDADAPRNAEREGFLAGRNRGEEDLDEHSDEEDRRRSIEIEERRRAFLMGNGRAHVSHIDVSASPDLDGDMDDGGRKNMGGLSAKAGIILGIHNVFVVIPQFLVTGLSSILFAIFDPEKSVLHGSHKGNTNNSTVAALPAAAEAMILSADETSAAAGTDTIALIFRIGGVSAAMAFVLCWRLARDLKHR
ncbi:hypothetical protein HGRIS_012558 [Hohenbuehelia grisea]|uniref:Sucrose transporter n=1 Tax=Hohenbuehelia grisea TaxID=104357 RepID=A0ABR3ISR0_9AGAR